ncbi:DNA protecting protein DprA [Candidatus Termititenax persephonae]|uniref:DNA protecting protein DprA n=1 Tax=Candidatus Termititenax persephonae TaxID=2218525 RepID=A0A388TH64_9BACT|nr:DNA protecting protein DprA [Candidatus Termititenax persephonae]
MSPLLGFSFFPDITLARLQFLLRKHAAVQAWQSFTAQDLRQLQLTPRRITDILQARDTLDLERFQAKLRRLGITVIDYFAPEYPCLLKEIFDPPILLFKKGALDIRDCAGIAVVGTRQPSIYGERSARQIVQALRGTIVSGLAKGIDAIAQQAALEQGLPTIAVLGTSVDKCYPAENRKLYNRLAHEGALISEYPDDDYAQWRFPRRNRIITGLSRAVIVVEGLPTSGALISGKIALEQNRDVYALPGQIDNPLAAGPNWLIAQGARPIHDLAQLRADLCGGQMPLFAQPTYTPSGDEAKICERIPPGGAVSMDTLLEDFDLSFLSKILLQMEIKGLISILPGKQIVRI